MSFSETERLATPPQFDYDRIELPDNVHLTIRLENHGSALDLPSEGDLSKEISDYDGLLVEAVFDRNFSASLGKIAKGDQKEYTRIRDICNKSEGESYKWLSGVISGVFNSRAAVANWDISAHETLAGRLMRDLDRLGMGNANARTEEQVLKLKPLQATVFEHQRDRDQLVMERLASTIGILSTSHSLFGKKLHSGKADVLALYGSLHRSLVDGFSHKLSQDPEINFDVRYHPESNLNAPEEELYARFL